MQRYSQRSSARNDLRSAPNAVSSAGYPSTPGAKTGQELGAQVISRKWKPKPTPALGATILATGGEGLTGTEYRLYSRGFYGDWTASAGTWGTIIGGVGNSPGFSFAGGLALSDFVSSEGAFIVSGYTFIQATRRIRQYGSISIAKCVCSVAGDVIFRVFRESGGTYTAIASSGQLPVVSGLNTFTLSPSLSCAPGDYVGVCLLNGAQLDVANYSDGVASLRYASGNVTEGTFSDTVDNSVINVEYSANAVFMAVTGDSIAEGNGYWDDFFGGFSGDITGSVPYRTKELIDAIYDGYGQYQCYADNSKTFAWVLSTGLPAAIASGAQCILIHCGINDAITGRAWSEVLSDLNAIKALITTQTLFVSEILPCTNASDIQSALIRLWNGYIGDWCAINGAILISGHDALGQERPSTGELDDLATLYDKDGVHLTNTHGAPALAAVWLDALWDVYQAGANHIQVRGDSSTDYGTPVTHVFEVGGVEFGFGITTMVDPIQSVTFDGDSVTFDGDAAVIW